MSLRERALRGGAYLTARELLGILLRLGGVLLVTRLIGPASFGLYAGSLAALAVLSAAAQLGAEVFLIRSEQEPEQHVYDQVFSTLLVSTSAAVLLGLGGSLLVGLVVGDWGFLQPFAVLLLALPLGVLWAPAQAKLERGFRFRSLALLQLGSDVALYAVAVALALAGAGVWAPVAGTFASYVWLLVLSYVLARYRPKLDFSRARLLELARYGAAFTPAGLLARAEQLANPLVVGTFLGAASVGEVALAYRLVDTVSFVLRATYRVSLVALGRVQNDTARLRRGFEEMMSLQVLVLGPILVGLAATAPWFVPLFFGDEWTPTLDVLPFVAVAALLTAVFNVHIALLYVKGRTLVTSAVGLVRASLLVAAAFVLVPPFGLVGYGLAVALTAVAWLIAHRRVKEIIGLGYGMTFRWVAAFLPALFIPLLESPWRLALLAPAFLVLLSRTARAQVAEYVALLRTMVSSRRAAGAEE